MNELERSPGRPAGLPPTAARLAIGGLYILLIALAPRAEACGFWGDAEWEDEGDAVWVDAAGNPIPDDELDVDDPEVQTAIANRFLRGEGVEKDYAVALSWLRMASVQGFAGAQNNLAVMYEEGLGVPKDEAEALIWYRRAAAGEDPMAQHSLGRIYREGQAVPRDLVESARWIRKSAEQGHHGAFRDMGELYWKGSGVGQSDVRACMWWKLAAAGGDEKSEQLLHSAAARMTPAGLAEAEKLAQEWLLENQ